MPAGWPLSTRPQRLRFSIADDGGFAKSRHTSSARPPGARVRVATTAKARSKAIPSIRIRHLNRTNVSRHAITILLVVFALRLSSAGADKEVLLDNFEAGTPGWTFSNGAEFPGAKGAFQPAIGGAHGGTGTAQLQADFRAGGHYVAAMRDLAPLNKAAVSELRFWVKRSSVASLIVRAEDATSQVHQSAPITLKAITGWQEVRLKIADLIGHGSWGGANDGRWHEPARNFALVVDAKRIGANKQATLSLDDVRAMVPSSTVIPTTSTLLGAILSQSSTRPGYGMQVTYRWDGVPMSKDYKVFVHVIAPNGMIAFQADHELPVPTSRWWGQVEYADGLSVPPGTASGDYRIVAGLWDPATGQRPNVAAGQGATSVGAGACQIAKFKVSLDAPLPALATSTLNLSGFRKTFDEDFLEPLDVSAWGPGTRWIAHTPFNKDFGDAKFADPKAGFPFTVDNGILRIEARRTNNKWQSGLLAAVDPVGNGFSQKFGYFEMRAKLPKGEGVWPAFWLMGVRGLQDQTITNIEIDVLEQYGARPNTLVTSQHFWGPGDQHRSETRQFIVPGMTDGYHRYGVMIDESWMIFYYDGVELRRVPTPPEAKVPVYPMVDLALGGGWPIANTPNPSYLYVDYIRVYARP